MAEVLLSTGDDILAEASENDKISKKQILLTVISFEKLRFGELDFHRRALKYKTLMSGGD